jgi:hypothetical protein
MSSAKGCLAQIWFVKTYFNLMFFFLFRLLRWRSSFKRLQRLPEMSFFQPETEIWGEPEMAFFQPETEIWGEPEMELARCQPETEIRGETEMWLCQPETEIRGEPETELARCQPETAFCQPETEIRGEPETETWLCQPETACQQETEIWKGTETSLGKPMSEESRGN